MSKRRILALLLLAVLLVSAVWVLALVLRSESDDFIPYDRIGQSLATLPADKSARIVLYCRSGNMSATASETLVQLGYTNIYNLAGGMKAWREAGFPLVEDGGSR